MKRYDLLRQVALCFKRSAELFDKSEEIKDSNIIRVVD